MNRLLAIRTAVVSVVVLILVLLISINSKLNYLEDRTLAIEKKIVVIGNTQEAASKVYESNGFFRYPQGDTDDISK